jgi:hypothetical protein
VPIYRTAGQLTDRLPSESVTLAQAYLSSDDMTRYLDPPLSDAVVRIAWVLDGDGRGYFVEAITSRELTDDELARLASWVSGQNSDGLGEGFEQQDFCWIEDGYPGSGDGHMVSFDWETNDSTFTRID